MAFALELLHQVLQGIGGEYLSEDLLAVRKAAQHVGHVQGELEDRNPAFLQSGRVPELQRGLAAEEELVHPVAVDDVDLLTQVEEDQSLGVTERDLHIPGEIHVLAVADDAVEGSRLCGELLGEQFAAGKAHLCNLESEMLWSKCNRAFPKAARRSLPPESL